MRCGWDISPEVAIPPALEESFEALHDGVLAWSRAKALPQMSAPFLSARAAAAREGIARRPRTPTPSPARRGESEARPSVHTQGTARANSSEAARDARVGSLSEAARGAGWKPASTRLVIEGERFHRAHARERLQKVFVAARWPRRIR